MTDQEELVVREELAKRARAAWDDPEVLAPRDRWVNYSDDESIVGWGYVHGILP